MKTVQKIFSIFVLAALFSLNAATPALAFDGRAGDEIVIEADEVINDDLYVTAETFTLEGTVKGDLFVFGGYIFINGTVEGDVFAAGNTVVIEGTVSDDARIAGAALQLGAEAVIGGDLVAAGASLETLKGSVVEQDAVYGGAQALLGGSIGRNLMAGAGSLELRGEIGGDARVEVGSAQEGGPSPSLYISDTQIAIPNIQPGLTIDENAKINGDFTYTQFSDIEIPSGTVTGKVTRLEPVVDESEIYAPPTPAETAANWTFDLIRAIVTLLIFGLLLTWLAPAFLKGLGEKLQVQPIPSFGWGIVACAAFFFAILVIVIAMIFGGIFFKSLTLGGVTAAIILVGFVSIFALTVAFALFSGFGAQVLAAWLGGRWIIRRFNPALAEHKFWPLLLGAALVSLLVKLPFIGWLIGFLIMLLGLGAFWLWAREQMKQPAAAAQ